MQREATDAPINILIVDDEPKNLTVLETLLDAPGYRLVRAESAERALLALVHEEFALLILDIRMPGMTGFELAQVIKSRKKTARVPIIFLTAYYNDDQHELEGYGSGAVDYLHKPVNAAVLRSKVAVFAEMHRKDRELTIANRALLAEVAERRRAEEQLRALNADLDRRVEERTLALSASDARLRLATDAVGLGIWAWTIAADAWTWENDWAHAILGLARSEASTSPARFAAEFVHAEDRSAFEQAVAATAARGTALRFEGRVQRPDGSLRWVEFIGDRAPDDPAGGARVLGTLRDTTDQRLAERSVRESEARYRSLFHSIDEGFCVVETLHDGDQQAVDVRFLECNAAFEKHVGLTDVIGRHLRSLLPEVEPEWLQMIGRVAETGESLNRSGEVAALGRYFEVRAFPVVGEQASRVAILLRDITERNRAEAALRERERFLSTVTGAARIGLAVIEPGHRYRYANDAYGQMLGLPPGDITGRTVAEILAGHGAEPYLERAFADERVSSEFSVTPADEGARPRHFGAFYEPHIDQQGLRTVVVVVVEITELKKMEQELRGIDRRKDEFLATLAHELRNPLAPINNAVRILNVKGRGNPELRWSLEVIERQVRVMARLIEDLMDVSRINQGRIELRRDRVELTKVLDWAVEGSRQKIEEYGHELVLSLPQQSILLDADLTRLAQVFMNLLTNAAKYTDKGGRIELSAREEDGLVMVVVKDNGIGIAPQDLQSVFVMFSQLRNALMRSRGGLGIGLSLTQRLVDLHGGYIEARSAGLGHGSEFVVWLPIWTPVEQAKPADGPAADAAAGIITAPGLRILVVDDNHDGADTLSALLSSLGHEVQTVYDGEAGLAAAESFLPDVLLLDIGLPKLNGYEVCRRIRQAPWGTQTTLIAMTGWGDPQAQREVAAAGFDRHLVKPVGEAVLMSALAATQRAGAH